jgi:single-strand DNA-binding protein
MPNFNKIIMAGHLTRDAEIRFVDGKDGGELAITKFGLATNTGWGDNKKPCFIDVTAFGKKGQVIAEHLGKGDPILVEGRLELDTWEDKETGAKRSKHAIVLDQFSFLGSGKDREATPPTEEEEVIPF